MQSLKAIKDSNIWRARVWLIRRSRVGSCNGREFWFWFKQL